MADDGTAGTDTQEAPVQSELARMARMMTTQDGVREITAGDRGVLSRTDDIGKLADFAQLLLTRFTMRRPPWHLVSVVAIVVLAGISIALLTLHAPLPAVFIALALLVPGYAANVHISRAERRRRQTFEAWFAAIGSRVEEIKRGELHGPRDPNVAATYEIAGLPAPVFVGNDVRIMTEVDRLAIVASEDIETLLQFQATLRARAGVPGISPWLTEVSDRLIQLATRG